VSYRPSDGVVQLASVGGTGDIPTGQRFIVSGWVLLDAAA